MSKKDELGQAVFCPQCALNRRSRAEIELEAYIKTFYFDEVYLSNRAIITPLELDIYIPKAQVAVEMNGMYWHSSEFAGIEYHKNKSMLCQKSGIHLIHIFEWDWKDRKNLCMSVVHKAITNKAELVQASDCITKQITIDEYTEFLYNNSLIWYTSPINPKGIYHNEILIGVFDSVGGCVRGFAESISHSIQNVEDILSLKHSTISLDYSVDNVSKYINSGYLFKSYTEPNEVHIALGNHNITVYGCGNVILEFPNKDIQE